MEDRKIELIYNASKISINILGIVDHKICHDYTIKYERIDKHTLITTLHGETKIKHQQEVLELNRLKNG